MTPLMQAAAGGNTDFILALLALGANAGLRDSGGRTALTWAVINRRYAAAAVLHDHLHSLNVAMVAALMKEGREKISSGERPPHSREATIRALLARGADPNATGPVGSHALSYAAAADDPGSVRALRDAGAGPMRAEP
jgi:ankyrin repeat protein